MRVSGRMERKIGNRKRAQGISLRPLFDALGVEKSSGFTEGKPFIHDIG